jgi:hypothetical protein
VDLRYFPDACNGISLGSLLALNDVKLDFVTLLQAFISVELNCAVMHKHVGTVIPANEAVTLRVVKPLDFAFVLSHSPVDLP